MPDLLSEMRTDIAEDESHLIREFTILRTHGNSFHGEKARFAYYEEGNLNLRNKIDLLEEYAFVRDITPGDTKMYRFEESFVELIAGQEAHNG